MNILTYYKHATFNYALSRLQHEFYFWHINDKPTAWVSNFPSCPDNVHFFNNDNSIHYDVAIVGEVEEAKLVLELGLDIPIIANCGGRVPESEFNNCADIIVASCGRNFDMCQHENQKVIYPGIAPGEFCGYSGDIAWLISPINDVANRLNVMKKDFMDDVGAGYLHSYIGTRNQTLDNGLRDVKYSTMQAIDKHARILHYAVNDDAGASYAVCEAMMAGMPIALNDFADWKKIIINSVNGYVSDDASELHTFVGLCLASQSYAKEVSIKARDIALELFHIDRFVQEWNNLICDIVGHK